MRDNVPSFVLLKFTVLAGRIRGLWYAVVAVVLEYTAEV